MYSNILVPVVFDDGHDTPASFRAAKTLADEGAAFTVLHVAESIPAYVLSEIPDDVLANTHSEIEQMLLQAAKALPDAKAAMRSGHPGRVIIDYAVDAGIDCIVLASHTPGLENWLIGSTADWVVRHAKCSVHVIR